MFAALALDEGRQCALLVILLFLVVLTVFLFTSNLFPDHAPAWFKNLLTSDLELDAVDLAQYRRRRELAVGQEDANEAACHEVKDLLFGIAQSLWNDTCRDDGVVVGHLR